MQPSVDVRVTSDPGAPGQHVKLAGAINETLSFTFSLTPSGESIADPRFEIQPFTSVSGRIDPSSVEIYRMQPVRLERFPGWHIRAIPPAMRQRAPLDVLVPLHAPRGGLPGTLLAGQTYHFWADVYIPKGTADGSYTSQIGLRPKGQGSRPSPRISSSEGGGVIDVELTVWPMVLPDESPIAFVADVDHEALFEHHVLAEGSGGRPPEDWRGHPQAAEYDRLLTATMRTLHGHRLMPVLPALAPQVRMASGGSVEVDWAHYDAIVEPMLSGRLFFDRTPLSVWPVPVARLFAMGATASCGNASASAEFMRRYISACIEHFEERGWAGRAYILAPIFEAETIEPAERVRQLGAAVARTHDVRLATRRFPQDMSPYGWVGFGQEELPDVDLWLPPAQFYATDVMEQQRRVGKATWVAIDRPPFGGSISLHAPATHAQILSWQAASMGAAAIHLGTVNDWPPAGNNVGPLECVAHNPDVLLYPGRWFGLDEPIPSVRLKQVRRSQQDAAYARLLAEHGLAGLAEEIRLRLSSRAGSDAYRTHFADGRSMGWATDALAYNLARQVMAEAMMSVAAAGKRTIDLRRTMAGLAFLSATETVELHVDGSRVRLRGSPPTMEAEIDTQLTVTNLRAAPVTGVVRFGQPPPGWTNVALDETTLSIEPGDARRTTLLTTATGLASGPDGVTLLPIELAGDDGVVYRQTSRIAFLTATPLVTRPRIDGDLSDWPPGQQNVASNFRLISGDPIGGRDSMERSRPGTRTTTLVMRDAENLYLAVTCESDRHDDQHATRRKGIHYDDLIPTEDEDLIEVLIDPSNAGTRSPSDLFHIAVKKSGTDLTEKGILTDPPCSAHQPWPVKIEVATKSSSRRWMVEMRLPLADIDPDLQAGAVWGFNVTRWDAERQEFSTWSGAVGNAYDPMSLGNLFLP